jgi:hypothetical protein
MSACPRCGENIGLGQEYCLECGARIPGPSTHGFRQDPGRGWVRRALVGLVVAVAGAAVAVAATEETGGSPALLTATGGFARAPAEETGAPSSGGGQAAILEWPPTQDGWTIALATIPQAEGKKRATSRAREALRSGLETVGVLDTSRYASLHPGYWLVFSGVYGSEAEATSSLQPARAFARTAVVRRIVP